MTITAQALEHCDSEPIHIPGTIQPNGVLIAMRPADFVITYTSDNSAELLNHAPQDLLGRSAEAVFGRKIAHALRNALQTPVAALRRVPMGRFTLFGEPLEAHAFLSDGHLVVEFEPSIDVAWSDAELSARIGELFLQINQQTSVDSLLQAAVRWLEVLSGFDRVMIYRFNEDQSGEVVAERNNSGREDFLNLCFPHWDIPKQARAIMLKLPLRMLPDIKADPVPLRAASDDLPPLDISLAHLRGMSRVHVQYLENMGVRATMTLSIVVEGKLWGLIAFHNYDPMVPAPRLRAIVLPFIDYFNVKLAHLIQADATEAREQARRILEDIRQHHGDGAELSTIIAGNPMPLLDQFNAKGMAIRLSGEWQAFGRTIPAQEIDGLIAEVQTAKSVIATDSVGARLTGTQWMETGLAGALAFSLGGDDVVVIFREAIEAQIKWAGRPEKQITRDGATYRLSPRGSFALYIETIRNRSAPWRAIDMELAEGLAALFLQSEKQRQRMAQSFYQDRDRQQRLMINELNHRVRNILALIRSISRQARRSNASLESYSAALEHRIKALAVAHNLSNDTSLTNVSLAEIVRTELAPYTEKDSSRFFLEGEDRAIRPDLCPIFALVIHEMSTNAAKYGAMSVASGRIDVSFRVANDGLHICWQEIGGPPARKPAESGFGTILIENAIPFELDGTVEMAFLDTGLKVDIWLPDDVLSPTSGSPAAYVTQFPEKAATALPLSDDLGTALLVEDNYAIALDAENMLLEIGFSKVVTAANLTRATTLLKRARPDFALLDMHLGSETSFPVARDLVQKDVPLVFATGYGSDISRPPGLDHIAVVTKPVELSTLTELVMPLLPDPPPREGD